VPSPFPTLEVFIEESAKAYDLDLFLCRPPSESIESVITPAQGNGVDYISTQTPRSHAVGKAKGAEGMRQALDIYKTKFPQITAILIGTRRTDPHGGQRHSLKEGKFNDFIRSNFISQKHDRQRLASVRTYKPNYQLVVPGRMVILAETRRAIL
jgi:3'-phosphoadenosine 5'-phosphosulfate sulfotransferase (PAPS reductase)/FAD synthetase